MYQAGESSKNISVEDKVYYENLAKSVNEKRKKIPRENLKKK